MSKDKKLGEIPRGRPIDDKLLASRAYRRARGLCQRCAEKWSRDHKCPATVPLNAILQVWDLIRDEDQEVTEETHPVDTEQLFLAISKEASLGIEAPWQCVLW